MKPEVLVKIAKVAGYVLPAVGGLAMAWASNEDGKKAFAKAAEKFADECAKNK